MAISISRALFALLGLVAGATWSTAQTGTALIRRAPTLNGSVEGSIQVMTAESVTMNSSARVEGDLLMPGTPVIKLNGAPVYGGTREGSGDASPSGHKVTLNGGAVLRHVVRRTDPLVLPGVSGPPQPTGIRSVSLNQAGQSPGDFSTLKHLTLNSKVGNVAVPPGTYGNFNANSGSGFVFGEVGSDAPGVYHFQNLTLNSGSEFKVVGPVVVTVAGNFSTNANMGDPAHPAWLKLRIAGGGLTLASQRTVSADLEAPNGALTLNGGSVFIGAVVADRLIVNSGAQLRLVTLAAEANQPPVVGLTSPTSGATFTAPAVVALEATASDADGTVVRVEFYASATKLGETTAIPAELAVTLTTPGRHVLTARAIDERGSTGVSAPVEIRVLPPWPYYTGFEAEEDYELGPLDGQQGWLVRAGVAQVTAETAVTGRASIALVPGDNTSLVEQQLGAPDAPAATIFVDVSVKPASGPTPGAGILLQLDNAGLTFVTDGNAGRVTAFQGDGQGGGSWLMLPAPFVLDAGRSSQWQRLTARLDYLAKTWDVYLNGRLLAYDLRFRSDTAAFGGRISIQGHPTVLSYFDDLYVGAENSLFQDADHDGMDDAWEAAHGLDPAFDDRIADRDRDGVSNISEYFLGTNPLAADSDSDGLSDAQEIALGTKPNGADSDGDGLPDGWEKARGFDPLSAADAAIDSDGDGVSNLAEFTAGTDPADYYNGQAPRLAVIGGDNQFALAGQFNAQPFVVVVTNSTGSAPLANAPVTFTVPSGGGKLALSGAGAPELVDMLILRTDANGTVQAYYQQPVATGVGSLVQVVAAATVVNITSTSVADDSTDGDGNGLPDSWELRYFGHTGLGPSSDEDGDGVINLHEYYNGTNPTDYYNGSIPVVASLLPADGSLVNGDSVEYLVTDQEGNRLVDAPVTFTALGSAHGYSPTRDDRWDKARKSVTVRTDSNGVARVYVVRADELETPFQ